ncbi:hypothetical protein DPEC_G00047070 [Dallia pectoralis]|uniref:Uncharacterized protein n=1 Tax=Dallia pectoralis TaxID=75939 RepID=A0ACC2HA90_DALPE|nr:hypothetical protein DPEC_G00047070 [Dallia pectoralis]
MITSMSRRVAATSVGWREYAVSLLTFTQHEDQVVPSTSTDAPPLCTDTGLSSGSGAQRWHLHDGDGRDAIIAPKGSRGTLGSRLERGRLCRPYQGRVAGYSTGRQPTAITLSAARLHHGAF